MNLSRRTVAHSFTNLQRFCEIAEIYSHFAWIAPHKYVNIARQKDIEVLYSSPLPAENESDYQGEVSGVGEDPERR